MNEAISDNDFVGRDWKTPVSYCEEDLLALVGACKYSRRLNYQVTSYSRVDPSRADRPRRGPYRVTTLTCYADYLVPHCRYQNEQPIPRHSKSLRAHVLVPSAQTFWDNL